MKRLLYISMLFACSWGAWAQTDLPTGQIEVVKDFEVRLTETKKIRLIPQPVPVDSTVRRYEYRLLAPSPTIDYLSPSLKPLAITPEQKPTVYPFFGKLGYGSPNALLGAISYDHINGESLYWGVDAFHRSANNKKIELQQFALTRGRVNAGYLVNENIQVDGYLDAAAEKHYFYGAESIPSNPEALRRLYNRYDVRLNLNKIYSPETSFQYNAFLQYHFDKDDLGTRENGLMAGGMIGSALGAEEHPIGVKLLVDLSTLRHTEEYAINNIVASPFLHFSTGPLDIHLGGDALLSNMTNAILPDLEFRYRLANPLLVIRAGWDGEIHKNNFHHLSTYNPYILTRLDSINNRISRRIYAGVSGTSGQLTYDVTAGHTRFTGMAFYLQDDFDNEQFEPIYDDGSYFGIQGSVAYNFWKDLALHASVSQRFFKLEQENKPWHVPSLSLNGQLNYTGGDDQYHVSLTCHVENGLPYRTPGGTEDRLDPLIDVNVHADYYITPSIGAFVQGNNLLGNKRERWFTYPSFGFNVMAGVVVRFP